MHFEWDQAKSEANKRKHGIDFQEALQLWKGRVTVKPTRSGNDASRQLEIGKICGEYWTAVTTDRYGATRIISVRRARDYERNAYDDDDKA